MFHPTNFLAVAVSVRNKKKVVCMADGGEFSDQYEKRLRQSDFEDLQREIAGLEVGRQRRFRGDDDQANPRTRESRQAQQQAQLTLLEQLLATDAAYRAFHKQAMDQVRATEFAAEKALREAEAARDKASDELQQVLDRSAKLHDGRACSGIRTAK